MQKKGGIGYAFAAFLYSTFNKENKMSISDAVFFPPFAPWIAWQNEGLPPVQDFYTAAALQTYIFAQEVQRTQQAAYRSLSPKPGLNPNSKPFEFYPVSSAPRVDSFSAPAYDSALPSGAARRRVMPISERYVLAHGGEPLRIYVPAPSSPLPQTSPLSLKRSASAAGAVRPRGRHGR